MGRGHDYYCPLCRNWWSALMYSFCPDCRHPGHYDPNLEAEELAPDGRPTWAHWEEASDRPDWLAPQLPLFQ